jgi:hypothetical protein
MVGAGAELKELGNGMKVVVGEVGQTDGGSSKQGSGLVGMGLFLGVSRAEAGIGEREVWARAIALGMRRNGAVQDALAAGGSLEAEARWKYVYVLLTAPGEAMRGCLEAMAGALREGVATEEEVEEAKRWSVADLKGRKADEAWKMVRYLEAISDGGRGLATPEEVERAVRGVSLAGLKEFERRFAVPGRMVLVVAGDARNGNGQWPVDSGLWPVGNGQTADPRDELAARPFPWEMGDTMAVEESGIGVAIVALGYSLEGASEKEWGAAEGLGLMMNAEMGKGLPAGWAAGAGMASRSPFGAVVSPEGEGGMMVVYGVCHPLRVEEMVEFLGEWVKGWGTKDMGEDRLERAKEQLAYLTAMRWQSVGMQVKYWGAWGLGSVEGGQAPEMNSGQAPEMNSGQAGFGLPGAISEREVLIRQVGAEAVREVAGKYLVKERRVVLMPEAGQE